MAKKYCTKCGTQLEQDDKFCSNCGKNLSTNSDIRTNLHKLVMQTFLNTDVGLPPNEEAEKYLLDLFKQAYSTDGLLQSFAAKVTENLFIAYHHIPMTDDFDNALYKQGYKHDTPEWKEINHICSEVMLLGYTFYYVVKDFADQRITQKAVDNDDNEPDNLLNTGIDFVLEFGFLPETGPPILYTKIVNSLIKLANENKIIQSQGSKCVDLAQTNFMYILSVGYSIAQLEDKNWR